MESGVWKSGARLFYCIVWNMREAHVPHNTINILSGEAARAPGERHEETGLARVQLIKHLGTMMRQSIKSNGDVEDKTIHYFLAYALDNDQSQTPLDPRFIGVGWFSPRQAIELIPYEQDRAFIQEHLSLMLNLN